MVELYCTSLERILIHLLEFLKSEQLSEVPVDITQEGIASAICVDRKHLPRSLKKLKQNNLILEKRNHVEGKKQMMKTYSLTTSGRFQALQIKNKVSDQKVNFIKNGKKITKSISEIFEICDKQYSYACIVSQVMKYSYFHEKNVTEQSLKKDNSTVINPEDIYRSVLEEAWKDGLLTVDERNILRKLRDTLNISKKTHYRIQNKILQSKQYSSSELYRQIYDLVLTEVLKDDKISKDEQAILEKLKKHFNIKS
jgi:hypothetical protein